MKRGKVFLVGAGPGDPGLLTIKARDLLAVADCVIYDYLVNPRILDHAPPGAERIDVGKRGTEYTWTQSEINSLLIAKGLEHGVVIRLKGGDPFVFGRGGEEAQALIAAGVEWEVVPGVSAGMAVAAYAGIPITHRSLSSSVAFITGHEDSAKSASSVKWEYLAKAVDTLVIFMGVGRIAEIVDQLIRNGHDPMTPVAVVRWGTFERQETWTCELEGLHEMIRREGISPPAIIVVGEVVKLRSELKWFGAELASLESDVA